MAKELEEALKNIKIRCHSKVMWYDPIDFDLETVEQALFKAQKLEKAWEILKPLCEVVETPVRKDRYLKINGVVIYTFKDREEFELIKEMLE